MSTQAISSILSQPSTTEDRWNQVQNLISLANDLARHDAAYRSNPAAGIGLRYTGLQTATLREQLINSPEVQGAIQAADSKQPLMFRLTAPYNLSLITVTDETNIPLTDTSKVVAGELLNRMYMPKGATTMMMRAQWAFRSALLPIPDRAPQS